MRTRDPNGRPPSRDEARAMRSPRVLAVRAYLRARMSLPQCVDAAQRRAASERTRDRLRVRDAARTRTEERRRNGNDHRVGLARRDHAARDRLPREQRTEQLGHRFPSRVLHVDDPATKRPAMRAEPNDAVRCTLVAASMRDRRRTRSAARAPRPRAVGHETRAAQRLGGHRKRPAEQLVGDRLELPQKHRHRASVGAVTGGDRVSCGISGKIAERRRRLSAPPSSEAPCAGCRRCGSSRPPPACRCGSGCRTAPSCRRP